PFTGGSRAGAVDAAPIVDVSPRGRHRRGDPVMTATLADTMPLLASHARSCADALNGVHVLWIGHGISDAVLTAQALAEAGGRLVSVVIPSGPPKPDVLAGYEKLGPVIAPPQPHPLQFPAVMRQAVTQAIRMVAERA